MDSEDAEDIPERQQSQVGVGAEGAVPQADVAGLQRRVELHGLRHVVGAQRGAQDLPEQPGAGVEQDQQVSHREPAAGTLVARLAELLLQLGGVGHRAARAVHDEDAMAPPAAIVVAARPADARQQSFGQAAKQPLEDPQREPLARLAEGRAGERLAAAAGHVVERGILIEDLEHEQMDRIGGVEEPILPGVVLLATGVVDGLLAEERGDILPDAPQDASESVMRLHRRVLPQNRWLVPSTSTSGDPHEFAGFAVTGICTGICVDNSMPFGTFLVLVAG